MREGAYRQQQYYGQNYQLPYQNQQYGPYRQQGYGQGYQLPYNNKRLPYSTNYRQQQSNNYKGNNYNYGSENNNVDNRGKQLHRKIQVYAVQGRALSALADNKF